MGYDLQEPCGSGDCNVFDFPTGHNMAPEGSPVWKKTKKPDLPEKAYGPAGGTAVAGVILCLVGGWWILIGLTVLAVGVGLGVRAREIVDGIKQARAAWPDARICMNCKDTIAPIKKA